MAPAKLRLPAAELERIKIQFIALGLITIEHMDRPTTTVSFPTSRPSFGTKLQPVWKLTEKGERQWAMLLAAKRG
jgi:hypothetical protein